MSDQAQLRAAPDRPPPPGPGGAKVLAAPWLPWCLLLVVSLPLITLTVGTYRTLRGEGMFFENSAPPEVYTRIAAVVLGRAPEIRLVPPLLGLAVTGWLLRRHQHPTASRALRTTAAALAGVLALQAAGLVAALGYLILAAGPADPSVGFFLPSAKLDELAPPLMSCLTLACLAALLALALVRDDVHRSAAGSAAPGTHPAGPPTPERAATPEDSADSTPRTTTPTECPAAADPHSAYRRPQPP